MLERLVAIKTIELQEKNDALIKQAEMLNKSNTLLEEWQQQIEKLTRIIMEIQCAVLLPEREEIIWP